MSLFTLSRNAPINGIAGTIGPFYTGTKYNLAGYIGNGSAGSNGFAGSLTRAADRRKRNLIRLLIRNANLAARIRGYGGQPRKRRNAVRNRSRSPAGAENGRQPRFRTLRRCRRRRSI